MTSKQIKARLGNTDLEQVQDFRWLGTAQSQKKTSVF